MIEQLGSENKNQRRSTLKVKFQFKALALILSVASLSWFFEAWRRLKVAINFENCALLGISISVTLFLLGVQAFWIYIEEKSKGTLKKQVTLFDKIEGWLKSEGRQEVQTIEKREEERACD